MEIALAHQSYGDGPPLILLHGLFGSGRNWTSIAKRLGERFRRISSGEDPEFAHWLTPVED